MSIPQHMRGRPHPESRTVPDLSELIVLEEQAYQHLRCCRHEEAARTFKDVAHALQLQRHATTSTSGKSTSNGDMRRREIGALEGLAVCLSRMLDDGAAELAQRKALALRSLSWRRDGDQDVRRWDTVECGIGQRKQRTRPCPKRASPSGGVTRERAPGAEGTSSRGRTEAAKRAAIPCLRNLASFISNQGRHLDAELVLRTVLRMLETLSSGREDGPRARREGGVHDHGDSARLSTGGRAERTGDVQDGHDADTSDMDVDDESSPDDEPRATRFKKTRTHLDMPACSSLSLRSTPTTKPPSDSCTIGTMRQDGPEQGPAGNVLEADHLPGAREASPASSRSCSSPSPPPSPPSSCSPSFSSPSCSCSSTMVPSGTPGFNSGVKGEAGHALRLEDDDRISVGVLSDGWLLEDETGLEHSRREEGGQDTEQVAAVTRHHLALVLHAQGRMQEAQQMLEDCVATLKEKASGQAVFVARAMHDLAGVVRPRDPLRACALYREALGLLEDARGKDHILTAPTLAMLGSLIGDGVAAAAAMPPVPAAPAGPGAAGIARAAGLAEAVCAPGQATGSETSAIAEAASASGWSRGDAEEAEQMIKRAVLIQGQHLGVRHPSLASSMRAMGELYRKQGRLSDAEPLFRRAIGIWDNSPGPMDIDAVAALHGLAHCVLTGAGADWLGRFEEAFALVDQAYHIASSRHCGSDTGDPDGSYTLSRLLLEALRMIRCRQRHGRGEPQPASKAIMDGIWDGRWGPENHSAEVGAATGKDTPSGGEGFTGTRSRGDDPRCAVCLEEVEPVVDASDEAGGVLVSLSSSAVYAGSLGTSSRAICRNEVGGMDGGVADQALGSANGLGLGGVLVVPDIDAEIGSEEARMEEEGNLKGRGRLAYLPCGHRFHAHCIGRWLVHSSSCPSCRSRVEEDPRRGDLSAVNLPAISDGSTAASVPSGVPTVGANQQGSPGQAAPPAARHDSVGTSSGTDAASNPIAGSGWVPVAPAATETWTSFAEVQARAEDVGDREEMIVPPIMVPGEGVEGEVGGDSPSPSPSC